MMIHGDCIKRITGISLATDLYYTSRLVKKYKKHEQKQGCKKMMRVTLFRQKRIVFV